MSKKNIILIIFTTLLILLILFTNKNVEKFNDNNNIYFMSYEETNAYLLKDRDNYVKNFSDVDLYARKVNTKDEYKESISKCSISFTNKQKNILIECIKIVDNFFDKYNKIVNGKEINKIKWKLALTYKNNNFEYEEGLPHTRENIIFITDSLIPDENNNYDNLIKILVHEKIHIYQKYNSKLFEDIIKSMGYMILPEYKIDKDKLYLRRSNPDINNTIYYNPVNNKDMVFYYSSKTPHGINDISTNNFSLEHPYEFIAYEIANDYSKNNIDKYINIT
jgi:hypothetical protein